MLICRTCLGQPYYTLQRDTEAGEKVKKGDYDSTIGDREKSRAEGHKRGETLLVEAKRTPLCGDRPRRPPYPQTALIHRLHQHAPNSNPGVTRRVNFTP